jgi:hypothetical protein
MQHIVDPIEILNHAQVLAERTLVFELAVPTLDTWQCLQWCAKRGRIANQRMCTYCGQLANLRYDGNIIDRCRWRFRCRNDHEYAASVRQGSFFTKNHEPIRVLVLFIHSWSFNLPLTYSMIQHQIGSWHTAVDCANFCRDVCLEFERRHRIDLGGRCPIGKRQRCFRGLKSTSSVARIL